MSSPNSISVPQLSRLLGTPSAPVIIDVSLDEDFDADPRLIPTAFRHPHTALDQLVQRLAGQRVVAVCQKGKKLSQGAVALLRTAAIEAEYLEGGNVAWAAAGEPRVPVDMVPAPDQSGATLWVTRHRPKIDRIACPWLIRRFIDPRARFLFVSPAEVADVAERFGATPFDVEGVFWSHRGEQCSFDTMLDEFALRTDTLARLAIVIRAADTNQHHLAPQAAGLLAVSVGLSRLYRDDVQQLEAGLLIYDALYRWARDGFNEGHDWPTSPARM